MSVAVYPGSFDPFTLGHLDIVKRAAAQFDEVIICVLFNFKKQGLFTYEERVDLIRRTLAAETSLTNVRVDSYNGLMVDYVRSVGATCMVKGVRTIADFEAESQLADINRMLAPELETFLLPARPALAWISSTNAKELALFHQNLEGCLSGAIIPDMEDKYQ